MKWHWSVGNHGKYVCLDEQEELMQACECGYVCHTLGMLKILKFCVHYWFQIATRLHEICTLDFSI